MSRCEMFLSLWWNHFQIELSTFDFAPQGQVLSQTLTVLPCDRYIMFKFCLYQRKVVLGDKIRSSLNKVVDPSFIPFLAQTRLAIKTCVKVEWHKELCVVCHWWCKLEITSSRWSCEKAFHELLSGNYDTVHNAIREGDKEKNISSTDGVI